MSNYTVNQAIAEAIKHHQAGRLPEAEALYRRVLAVAPNHPDALHLLGEIAYRCGQLGPAQQLIERAIAGAPNVGFYHNTLGEVFRVQGRLDEAMACYTRALSLMPNLPEAICNSGIVHAHRCQLPEAIACFERAIALRPDFPEAHDGLGLSLLMAGDLPRGFREQEWRWKKAAFPSPRRNFPQPLWDGSDLNGKTILIHAEQGFGDAIQFCRYVPLVMQRGGRVILECQAELIELMRTLEGPESLVARGQPLPPFDIHCPMLSLPLVMGTTLETILGEVGYLKADPARLEKFRGKINAEGLKVGIVWSGGPVHSNDRNRSTSLATFAPLASVPGVQLYSLQKGEPAAQAGAPPPGLKLTDLSNELNDFADTAAAVQCLDLVIAVDTAVVHVAGALGRPVWNLLAFMPDWRWLMERSDTPWYPTMRLFRQRSRGDWVGVMGEVVVELKREYSAGTPPSPIGTG